MKVFRYLAFISVIISNQPIFGMNALQKKQEQIFKKQKEAILETPQTAADIKAAQLGIRKQIGERSLIILFDPKNEDNYKFNGCSSGGALIYDFKGALQSNIPIITSGWFLDYAIHCADAFTLLSNKWNVYAFEIRANNIKYQDMYVFMPKNLYKRALLKQYGVKGYSSEELNDGAVISGIKINEARLMDQSGWPAEAARTFINPLFGKNGYALQDLKACLNQILVTRADLKNGNIDESYLNTWDIYLSGHGTSEKDTAAIAAVPIGFFKSLLDFFNFGISTRSLFYSSCYSGGENLEKTYEYSAMTGNRKPDSGETEEQRRERTRSKDVNYMIISANAFGTTTTAQELTAGAFDRYFNMLNQYITRTGEPLALDRVIGTIYAWDASFEGAVWRTKGRLELPTVRPAHAERFVLTSSADERLFVINDGTIERIINGNKDNKTIVVPETAQMIVVQSRYVPIPIVIKGFIKQNDSALTGNSTQRAMPTIVPQEPDKDYFFTEIRASDVRLVGSRLGSPGLTEALSTLKNKIDANLLTGKWYIQSLIIDIQGSEKNTDLKKEFGSVLDFNKVIMRPAAEYITLHLDPKKLTQSKPLEDWYSREKIWNRQDPFVLAYNFYITQESLEYINKSVTRVRIGKQSYLDGFQERFATEEAEMPEKIDAIRKSSKLPESIKK